MRYTALQGDQGSVLFTWMKNGAIMWYLPMGPNSLAQGLESSWGMLRTCPGWGGGWGKRAENCGPFQLPTPPGALSCLHVPYVASSVDGLNCPFLLPPPQRHGHPDFLNTSVLGLTCRAFFQEAFSDDGEPLRPFYFFGRSLWISCSLLLLAYTALSS